MGLSIKPTISCNLGCTYCYENNIRSAGNAKASKEYDMKAMVNSIRKQFEENIKNNKTESLVLHGGEILLLPKDDLEEFMQLSYNHSGKASIQTNGELIDEDHIRLFKKYNVNVGVSIDGLGELNLGRWKGTKELTLEYTEKLWNNIKKLRENQIKVGVIIVVSKMNGIPQHRKNLKDFLLKLKSIGIKGGRLNPIQVDEPSLIDKFELSNEQLTEFYLDMAEFTLEHGLRFTPFTDVIDQLLNTGLKTCIYTKCDWYHTKGERVIMSDGEKGGCLKTAKDGVMFLVNENGTSDERYQILKNIPRSEGGCGGCRYWNICYGLCPAEGQDGDWRDKSRYCSTYYGMYQYFEKQIKKYMPNLLLSSDIPQNENYPDTERTFQNINLFNSVFDIKKYEKEVELPLNIKPDQVIQVSIKGGASTDD